MPTAASRVASTMNATNDADSSTFSLVRASTSSHTTASAGAPLACSTARSARSEIWVSISSRVIEPSRAIPSSLEVGDDHARVLARDVGQDHVAGGVARASRRAARRCRPSATPRAARARRRSCRPRATIRRWITGRSATAASATLIVSSEERERLARTVAGSQPDFARSRAKSDPEPIGCGARSVRRCDLPSRTHVPSADDPPTEQTARFASWCVVPWERHSSSRRWARQHSTPRMPAAGSPAGRGFTLRGSIAPTAAHPHRRRLTRQPSQAPWRHGPPARTGLPDAGASPGAPAGLTARRRPVWEDGSADGLAPSPGRRASSPLGPSLTGRPECVEARRRDAAAALNDDEPPVGRLVGRNRRRPTLPGPCEPSTIGAVGLNCSVRNGKRCFPHAIATGN